MLRGPDARLRLITVLLIAALLPLTGQLVRLQVLEHDYYKGEAEKLVNRPYTLPEPPWGIVMDRHGDLLIGNTPVYDIGAEINLVTDTVMSAAVLSPLLNRPKEELIEALTMPPDTEKLVWRSLAKRISPESYKQIVKLGWPWITTTPTWQRYYAEGAMASHTLGFVNEEGMGYGVQAFQLRFLRGERVERVGSVSGDTSPLPGEFMDGNPLPYPGTNLRLTIDRTIQAYIEGELDQALLKYNAEGGTILVMDPRSGEIIAIASRPNYEPFRYPDYAQDGQEKLFQDPAVSIAYEPGSVFKLITIAAAIDSEKADLNWSYNDQGTFEYGGVVIHNATGAAYGQQGLQGVLEHSLNIGVAELSTHVLGPETFYQYVRDFGFGQTTGIEVTGESDGYIHIPTDWDWTDSYLATNAFGQGIAVTPIQMAAAVCAIANDGVIMQPHIIAERYFPDGRAVLTPPHPLNQPISAETARMLAEMMARTVENTIKMASVPGYRVAGKTGTAQIPTTGGYDPEAVITSFVGFGPLPEPEVLILVKLDRPNVPLEIRWGTQTAAPVFQEVASKVFILLGIPPTDLRAGP